MRLARFLCTIIKKKYTIVKKMHFFYYKILQYQKNVVSLQRQRKITTTKKNTKVMKSTLTAAEVIQNAKVFGGQMLTIPKDGQHYKSAMRIGRVFPTTKAQAIELRRMGAIFDVLGKADLENIEMLMNKHGKSGKYTLTKSESFARIANMQEFYECLKDEYQF